MVRDEARGVKHNRFEPAPDVVTIKSNVFDVGPTLYKCYTHVLCLLGGKIIHVFTLEKNKWRLNRPCPLTFTRVVQKPGMEMEVFLLIRNVSYSYL